MFRLKRSQWRAVAMALLIVTGTLALVSMPLPVDEHSGVAMADKPTDSEYDTILDNMEGSGTVDDPYVITNVDELQAVDGDYGKFEAKASPFRAGMKPTNSIQPPSMA